MTRPPSGRPRRGRPAQLEQIPVWADHVAVDRERPGKSPPTGVDALLAGLNADQKRAVTHDEGPLLVVAGAGTGKTQVVTRRIAWLIATGRAKPSEILALTFTDKAAEEMQARVDRLVPYGYTDTVISTFHAFGDRVIREHALELGLPSEPRVLSRPETVIFLSERLFRLDLDEYRPLGNPTRFLAALASLFSRLKDEDVSPDAFAAHAARLAAEADSSPADDPVREARLETARRQAELAGAYARYQELLGEAGAIDFGDQVALALRLLREHPAARAELQARFRYVLVDEFQDVNRAQAELVALVAEPRRNIAVVGDDDQSIYRFRGAATGAIIDFLGRFQGARTIVLRRNYRSRAAILDAAYRLIRFNDPDRLEVQHGITKQLVAQRREPRGRRAFAIVPVRHVAFGTGSEEADWIAGEIAARIAKGASPGDHAILVRANSDADAILRSLNVAAVPWRFSGISGLYARPEIRVLLSFLRVVGDPDSSVDVYGLAASDTYGLGGADLASLANRARRTNRSLWETLAEVDDQPGLLRLHPETRTALARLVADLHRYIELGHQRPAGELLYDFLRASGSLARLVAAETVAAEEALSNVARFFEIVRAQSDLLADDRAVFLAPHLATLIDAGDDPATADLDPEADAVSVTTLHKAKGLEWPVVFLVGLVDGRFPARGRREQLTVPDALLRGIFPGGDAHVQEERRLFYVGMTRARDGLVLTHALDYGGKRTRRVSPFVLEALDLPAGTAPGAARRGLPRASCRPRRGPRPERRGRRERPDRRPRPRRAAGALLLPGGCLPHLPAQVPLRPCAARADRAAPRDRLRRGPARGGLRLPSQPRPGRGDDRGVPHRGLRGSLVQRGVRLARARGSAPRSRPSRPPPLPRGAARPGRRRAGLRGAGVRVHPRRRSCPRPDGPRRRPAPRRRSGTAAGERAPRAQVTDVHVADVVEATLPLLRERVVITDYKSSDVRDPARARERARESLQLTIYAMAWQAQTGRLPDAVALSFLESGLVGTADVDAARVESGVAAIRTVAAGIRAGAFAPSPSYMACSWCAFREICRASVAP